MAEPTPIKKPLLLYAPIYDYVAETLVNQMNEIPDEEDIELWVNSPGGRVFAGWSIIGPMIKRKGKIYLSVFGHAASMSAYLPLFATKTEALEVTQFMIHRADGYVETPEDQALLDSINKDLRKQMESRLDMDAFVEITGKSMNDIFNPNTRVDVWLTAKQAKKVGLIQSIKKLTEKEAEAYTKTFVSFADLEQRSTEEGQRSPASEGLKENSNNKQTQIKMTKEEFKAQHPAIYAEVVAEGKTIGINAERSRVKTFLAYKDVDSENIMKAISEGSEFTSELQAELQIKALAAIKLDALKKDGKIDSAGTGEATGKTEAEKQVEAVSKEVAASVRKQFNIK